MKKPIIGITLDSEMGGGYSKFPWYAIRNNYLDSVKKFGGIPFPLFHEKSIVNNIFEIIDGLIITGGNFDINPEIYGKKNKKSRSIKNNRTEFEIKILTKCLNSNKPILGICGGEQLLNVVCGGTLIQDIKSHYKKSLNHEQKNPRNQTSHTVDIIKNSMLYKIINKKKILVNSAHHQAIEKIGKKLVISGTASDGVIESIEHDNHKWCIGIQWHPEFLITQSDKLIIKNFIKATKS